MSAEPKYYSVIVFKVTGMLSMLATSYMMYEISTDERKRKRTYFRLMFGMSFIEFWDALAFFLGPWASPGGRWGVGNNASCQFQAFLLQASVGSILYNAFLSLYYLLSIRYDWSERLIAQKVEPWMHGITLSIAYGTAIACIPLGLFTRVATVCYIGKQPRGCQESYQFGDEANCTQGDNATLYQIFFMTLWQWMSIAFTAVSMIILWCGVRAQENKMARYAFGDNAGVPVRKDSRRFMIQGLLYVFVYYFCHFFATVALLMIQGGNFNGFYELNLLVALTFPLEGFLNFLVYMRPRLVKYLRKRRIQLEATKKSETNELAAIKPAAKKSTATELAAIESAAAESGAKNTAATELAATDLATTNTNSADAMEDQHAAGDENHDWRRSALMEEIRLDEQEQDDLDEY